MSFPKYAWSTSRASLLRECPRRYFWTYYGSWEGWRTPSSDSDKAAIWRRRAYSLKQIRPLPVYFGSAVHDSIAERLRLLVNNKVSVEGFGDAVAAAARKLLNDAVVSSRDEAKWLQSPRNIVMLAEQYMGGLSLYPDVIEGTKEKLARIPAMTSCKTLSDTPEQVLEIDQSPFDDRGDWGRTAVEGVPAYARVDYLYVKNGIYHVVDWKTAADTDAKRYRNQVFFYAYYVSKRYNVPMDKILCRIENVVTGAMEEFTVDDRTIEIVLGGVKASIRNMAQYVKNGDLNRNEPLHSKDFAKCESGRCRMCPFAELCFGVRGHAVGQKAEEA